MTTFPIDSVGSVTSGADGAIWFTSLGKIGRIDATGAISEFPTSTGGPAVQNRALTFGSDGNLWFTSPGHISRMTTAGVVTEFSAPSFVSAPKDIKAGPDGNLWFTGFHENLIGRISTDGFITQFQLPTAASHPSRIATGPDGNLWFTEYSAEKIGRITTAGAITEFALRKNGNRFPSGITAGTDGNLWFTEQAARVGRITPNGEITEFPVPGEWGETFDVVAGANGNLWFVGWGEIHRVTTSGGVTTFSSIPTYEPWGVAASTDGAIWIAGGFEDVSQILRFAPGAGSCVTDAATLCLNNGRFRVTANWKTADGSTGAGRALTLSAKSGYFWFFDPANIELIVKVLDGCSANGNFWIFAAGLTNIEVVLKVTDTWTGQSREYTNAKGTPFAPIQDTAAFTACP